MVYKCKECSNDINEQKYGLFCSKKCYSKDFHKTHYISRKKDIDCIFCGTKFLGIKDSKYCSRRCYHNDVRGKSPIEIICKGCSIKFIAMHKSKLYCSDECREKYRIKSKVSKPCRKCGKHFVGGQGRLYCSVVCIPVIKKVETVDLICRQCNNNFKGWPNWKYCSKECRNKYKHKKRGGKKHNKKGKVCEFCGFTDTRAIHAHHVNRAEGLGVMFLCANHHYIFHAIVGHGIKSENRSKEEVINVLKSAELGLKFPLQ